MWKTTWNGFCNGGEIYDKQGKPKTSTSTELDGSEGYEVGNRSGASLS